MKKTLLAIDGNSILNRAFYGIRPLTNGEGFPTNALYGMVTMVMRQAEALSPDYTAVAFDLKAPTFRHKMYGEYKAGRRPMPEDLVRQLPVAKELMQALGFCVLEMEGYEADDILGTLARMCDENDITAYLMTGDRDALQLIDPNVHVLLATNTETVDMNEDRFFEKYGVPSSRFVDVKALMGDSSDHIPGVPGIGEKTALRLIADYGSLDGVYRDLPVANHTPSVRKKLEEGKDSAYLSQSLARICTTVPLGISPDAIRNTGINRSVARNLFLRLNFTSFMKRFGLDRCDAEPDATPSPAPIAPTEVIDADLETLSSALCNQSILAFDREGDRNYVATDEAVFCTQATGKDLLPLLDGKTVVCYDCKSIYKDPDTASLSEARVFDLMLAAYLADSSKSGYAFSSLVPDQSETAGQTAPRIASFLSLYRELSEKLTETGQQSLFWEMEMPLAKVLSDMEIAGFRIDREGIFHYGEQLEQVAKALETQIYFHAGREFNVNSPKQLGEILFDTLGLPHAKKTKTGYSTNAEVLEKLRPVHPIIDDILDYRKVTKLKSTYADGLLKVADENGRVHTTFKQTGTATGRLSSTEPNLQNIPVRTDLGRELRRFFLPENENNVIIDADYSQIELRILAHISGDEKLIESFRAGVDVHTATAATVFGVAKDQVTHEMRKQAKAVNFGILYGIGAFSLSDDIHVSIAEAQTYINQYLAGYPKVDEYLKKTIREAYENGYVTTLFGRRRRIPELAGSNKVMQKFGERVAMNSPIQGTAADIIKLAMIRVHDRLKREGLDARLILQVHDELLIEARRDCAEAAKRALQEEMEHAVSYSVPLDVDIHIGNNWYEAK